VAYAAHRELFREVNLLRRSFCVFIGSFCIKSAKNYKKKNKDFAFFSESVYSAEIQPIFPPPKNLLRRAFLALFGCKRGD
jgi:hypothetical protein